MTQRIPLRIDFGMAKPHQPYPIRGGVPFARGVLPSVDQLRLVTGQEEQPCQVTATACWPDGSTKWVMLDFMGVCSGFYYLEHGAGIARGTIPSPIELKENDGSIQVDTGPLSVVISGKNARLFDSLVVDGATWISPVECADREHVLDFIHVTSTAARPVETVACSGVSDPSRVEVDQLTVEEAGPIHGVVLVRGNYRYQHVASTIEGITKAGVCPFTIRLHFWAGSRLVSMEHFFAFDGDPDVDFVRQSGIGLSLPPICQADTLSFGADTGRTRRALAGKAAGLYQGSPDHFEVWETGANGVINTVARGCRADGWVHAYGPQVGVAFGVRQFWQQYHKSLHVDVASGRIDAWLWAPEAQTLDHRRYAREWGVGEDGAYDNGPVPVNYRLAAKGTGKSHELLFCFHTGQEDDASLSQLFAAFEERPLVLAPLEQCAESKALGHYHARTAGAFEDLERIIQLPFDYLRVAQEQARWYGFFDFGDVQSCYATFHKHDRWENDFGRWGWGNGDQVGRLNYALMLQYIRTGDRQNFLFAEANMRHVHDVDVTHTTEYPFKMGEEFRNLAGSAHRHNAQHWACPYVGSRGAHPMGARIHYFLTGSGRSKDIVDEVLALAERIPQGAANDGHGVSALSFLCAWERTGQLIYRDKALQALESFGLENIRGGWMAMISAAFGVFDAMVEYTDLSGDERFIPTIASFAEMCMGPDIETNWTYPGGYFRIYAEALRFSGKHTLVDGINRAIVRLVEQMATSSAFLPREQWPAPGGASGGAFSFSNDANTLRDLPFLMHSLGHHAGGSLP